MSLSILTAFWAVSFLFVITPGIDWAYAISAGIRGRMVMPAVSGMLLGHLAATCLVAAGIGTMAASVPWAMTLLTILGACYLLWLGIGLIRQPIAPASDLANMPEKATQWLLKGVGVSGLNPKVLLLFLALLPQFYDPNSNLPLSWQMLLLGGIHLATTAVVYLMVGYAAQYVLQTKPSAALAVSRFSGFAMTIIALLLLAESVANH